MNKTNPLYNGRGAHQEQVQEIAENPNPRANENIKQTSFDEKSDKEPGNDVGTEITDGEGG